MTHRRLMLHCVVALIVASVPTGFLASPSVYPTGTTIYQPDKAWSGYTVFGTPEEKAAVLVDMNNKWYDEGDERFHPENILWGSRTSNLMAVVERTGAVVWRMGPDYREPPALRELDQIIGQHHPQMITWWR